MEAAGLAGQYAAFRLRSHKVHITHSPTQSLAHACMHTHTHAPIHRYIQLSHSHTRTHTPSFEKGALICPSAADPEDDDDQTSDDSALRRRRRRLAPLASLLPLQQFGFPMRSLECQRRMGYELLFYRATAAAGVEGVKV